MKMLLVLPMALVGLTGCAVYTPHGYSGGYVYSEPAVYVQPAYVRVHPGYRGSAVRDRDGDGVANRYDRDRDGDGVPNRYDRRPNNPRRQ